MLWVIITDEFRFGRHCQEILRFNLYHASDLRI
jgi:hypothetical protein